MIEVKAPNDYVEYADTHFSIFLAGSIEMGVAINWQEQLRNDLIAFKNVLLLNPRRDDWDSSWVQDISDPQFAEQVEWEMNGLDSVDMVVINFEPGTQSPITLLELGLVAGNAHVVVCCPEGFWRRGNVQIVCDRFDIPLFDNKADMLTYVQNNLPK